MSLAEKMAGPPGRPARPTRVGALLDDLPGPESDALMAALKDPRWSVSDIVRTLREEGVYVSVQAVRHYREVVL